MTSLSPRLANCLSLADGLCRRVLRPYKHDWPNWLIANVKNVTTLHHITTYPMVYLLYSVVVALAYEAYR